VIRTSKNITFNETEITISINIRNLLQETTISIAFIKNSEIITTATNINDTNITPENAKNALSENITIDPAPVRKSIQHRKAIFKIVEINTVGGAAVGAAETFTTPADVEDLLYNYRNKNHSPQTIIAKSITVNENKPIYEKAMASSKKSQ
jgi:hypothetical protein